MPWGQAHTFRELRDAAAVLELEGQIIGVRDREAAPEHKDDDEPSLLRVLQTLKQKLRAAQRLCFKKKTVVHVTRLLTL